MFVQNLNPTQQEILLKLADDLMLSDGVKDQREEDLIRIIKSQCNADISSKKEFELSGLANLFVSKKAKVSLLLELIGLAHADGDYGKEDQTIVTNARHYEILRKCEISLVKVEEGLDLQIPGDLLAMDIRETLYHLGEITGQITTDDLLGNIFANFCIGK